MSGFCNGRCIKKRNLGSKRIANIMSAIANMDMTTIFIIWMCFRFSGLLPF